MIPVHSHSNLFTLPHSICQFYPQDAASIAPHQPRSKEERKQLFESSFRAVRKNLLSFPENLFSVLIGPDCVKCPFLDQLLARAVGLPWFHLEPSLELRRMGSAREGLTPEQNVGSVRTEEAGNRGWPATAASLEPSPSPCHHVASGPGKDKLALSPYLFKPTSAEMYLFPSALWSLLSLWQPLWVPWKPSPLPWHPLLGLPHPITKNLWVCWFSGPRSPYHAQPQGKCQVSRMLIFQILCTQRRGPGKSYKVVSHSLCQDDFR